MRLAITVVVLTAPTAGATFCCGHSSGTTRRPATFESAVASCDRPAAHVLLQERSRSRRSVTPPGVTPPGVMPPGVTARDPAPASRTRVTAMVHTTDELQLAAALVLPLLAYKVAAIIRRNQLQWYLDASIALATASLLVYAAS